MEMNTEFRNWLNMNRYGNYRGTEITPSSEMVSYTYVISLLVITFRRNTRYYFLEAEKKDAMLSKVLCILCNLTLGWWGIPWGPIWTVKETICNLCNTKKATWGELLERGNGTAQGN